MYNEFCKRVNKISFFFRTQRANFCLFCNLVCKYQYVHICLRLMEKLRVFCAVLYKIRLSASFGTNSISPAPRERFQTIPRAINHSRFTDKILQKRYYIITKYKLCNYFKSFRSVNNVWRMENGHVSVLL